MRNNNLDDLIAYYVENQGKDIDEDKRNLFIDSAKKDLRTEILNEIELELKDKIITNYKSTQKYEKFNELKMILLETIGIGFLIGLLVNQITDLISLTKGSNCDANIIPPTIVWIASISIVLILLILYSTINRIRDLYDYFKEGDK